MILDFEIRVFRNLKYSIGKCMIIIDFNSIHLRYIEHKYKSLIQNVLNNCLDILKDIN